MTVMLTPLSGVLAALVVNTLQAGRHDGSGPLTPPTPHLWEYRFDPLEDR